MAAPTFETVLYQVEDGIALVTLNRPEKLNAFNTQMMKDLIAVFDETDKDDAASGFSPRRAKTKPYRASVEASRMSIASCMVTPTPTAAPLQAEITGFRLSKIRRVSRPPPSRGTSPCIRIACSSGERFE